MSGYEIDTDLKKDALVALIAIVAWLLPVPFEVPY
jgi:hypothetical protein